MESSLNRFKIFVDFDGTITKLDVGEHIFLRFADNEKVNDIIQDWIAGKITSRQTWEMLCEATDFIDRNEFDAFINTMEIEKSFIDFVEYCNVACHDVFVLSDGFDYYIDKIFAKYNLQNLKLFSNKLKIESGKLLPSFPYTDEECKVCANCKRNHILANSADEEITIYIGDGLSDTCPAQFVDFIFAKKSLLKFCEENRISYFPFKDFNDVKKIIVQLSQKKKIKKRHQAQLKRRAVYLQG